DRVRENARGGRSENGASVRSCGVVEGPGGAVGGIGDGEGGARGGGFCQWGERGCGRWGGVAP
ncbi:UNVERIFIED_CONTAM: malto-oligosyltrehalose trehalohydrolase, partial [Bifidobacterium breve]|nr:malto-oligosyltrehalose trehalohydrolase [Bifidobacterium breve]